MIVRIYFYILSIFILFLFLVNAVTALSSQCAKAIFYPYHIKSRAEAAYNLLSFIIMDSGVVALGRNNDKVILEKEIRSLCAKHNMDYNFVYNVIKVKSNFNPYKIALDGSVGLLALPLEKLKSLKCSNPFNYKEYLDMALETFNKSIHSNEANDIQLHSYGISNYDNTYINSTNKPMFYNPLLRNDFSVK
jgi:hypothetical protein